MRHMGVLLLDQTLSPPRVSSRRMSLRQVIAATFSSARNCAERSMVDIAFRQCLLKFFDSRDGDAGSFKIQVIEAGQRFETFYSRIGHISSAEIELPELSQSFEVNQTSVTDFCLAYQ